MTKIIINLIGLDRAECPEMRLSVKSRIAPLCTLARAMIEAGASPASHIVAMRGDVVAMRGALGWFAVRTVAEGDAACRFAKWAPFDASKVREVQ